MTIYSRIQDISDQRRLAAAADTCHHCKHPKRKFHIYILEVMLHRTLDSYRICPVQLLSHISLTHSAKILESQRPFIHNRVYLVTKLTLENDFATMDSCLWSYVYKDIRRPHYLFVMFNHHNGIANVPQPLKNRDKSLCVTRVQTDTRLIKYI